MEENLYTDVEIALMQSYEEMEANVNEDYNNILYRHNPKQILFLKKQKPETISNEERKSKIANRNKDNIQKSKEMIENSNLLMKDIAKSLGFRTKAHFSTEFKRLEGVSPSEYLKIIQNKKK